MIKNIVTIPVYEPGPNFSKFIVNLSRKVDELIVINDGSSNRHNKTFLKLGELNNVTILTHQTNEGKGAALKTAFIYYLKYFSKQSVGLVTADADEQHMIDDIINISESLAIENKFIIGSRKFDSKTPIKSRLGNLLTSKLSRVMYGLKISDSQSGLRGIPVSLLKLFIKIKNNGYDFEMECLLSAKKISSPIKEIEIQTVYLNNNINSHFKPIVDSFKIYDSLFRFGKVSIFSLFIDNAFFLLLWTSTENLLFAYIASRTISFSLNFYLTKTYVFKNTALLLPSFFKYTLLSIINLFISYHSVTFITDTTIFPVIIVKLIVDFIMFNINFRIQKFKIFVNR